MRSDSIGQRLRNTLPVSKNMTLAFQGAQEIWIKKSCSAESAALNPTGIKGMLKVFEGWYRDKVSRLLLR